jgi:ubiquinone/menaquinone biosynthesis C-methylase UbiE
MRNDTQSPYGANEANTYDVDREGERHWRLEHAFVEKLLRRSKPTSLLDVPVGTGRFLPLYQAVPDVHGIDLSPDMLLQAKRCAASIGALNPVLEVGSIFDLPLADSSVDLTLCCRLLHLLPEDRLAAAFAEVFRVTRKTVCAQAYVPGRVNARALHKVLRLANKLMVSAGVVPPESSPWSHIHAWFHPREVIEAAAASQGWTMRPPTELCHYKGSLVLMYEWDRD